MFNRKQKNWFSAPTGLKAQKEGWANMQWIIYLMSLASSCLQIVQQHLAVFTCPPYSELFAKHLFQIILIFQIAHKYFIVIMQD